MGKNLRVTGLTNSRDLWPFKTKHRLSRASKHKVATVRVFVLQRPQHRKLPRFGVIHQAVANSAPLWRTQSFSRTEKQTPHAKHQRQSVHSGEDIRGVYLLHPPPLLFCLLLLLVLSFVPPAGPYWLLGSGDRLSPSSYSSFLINSSLSAFHSWSTCPLSPLPAAIRLFKWFSPTIFSNHLHPQFPLPRMTQNVRHTHTHTHSDVERPPEPANSRARRWIDEWTDRLICGHGSQSP